MSKNVIHSINGPVITVNNTSDFSMLEMVYVGKLKLMGEVISISNKTTVIQVYESTTGVYPGEEIEKTGKPVSIDLGPGLLNNIFDGILRPLKKLEEIGGAFISRGSNISSLDEIKKWDTKVLVKKGDFLKLGDLYASTKETSVITHKMFFPFEMGEVLRCKSDGMYSVKDEILEVLVDGKIHKLSLIEKWPIKTPRRVKARLAPSMPLSSGQRIIDTLFPIAKGGAAAIPGGFGAGKTMLQHQFAKWCDADIIVYVGCGERGNEMTQVLEEFGELIDPRTGKSLLERTVLIANTSNMPVAAREASIYTGITVAEYYRDMGYHVAIMADSTSRWAEALREISGRLEEMPAEEGFPAYLPSRLAKFYERAGYVKTVSGAPGSVTIIGAVSPQGADFSEPVTQNTKRFVRSFWALDKELAYKRHFPSVNWNQSYSEYIGDLSNWYDKNVGTDFLGYRQRILELLAKENKLLEIVKLIGGDILPDDEKLIIKIGEVIRVGFLQQNAFHKNDMYVSLDKQLLMMKIILFAYDKAREVVSDGKAFSLIENTKIFDVLIKLKYEVATVADFNKYFELIEDSLAKIV